MANLQVGLHIDGDVWEPEQIKAVEDHGFDIMTTGEHMVFFRPILDTVTVLSYAAAVTSKIKLVPSTLILPLRHPTVMAKELTSIDILSKGRLIASVGIGGDYPREFQACGISMKERGRRANEGIETPGEVCELAREPVVYLSGKIAVAVGDAPNRLSERRHTAQRTNIDCKY